MVMRMARIILLVAWFSVVAACTGQGEPAPVAVTATEVATQVTREQSATPAPAPESTPRLTATITPTPTQEPTPAATPTPTPSPTPTATPRQPATVILAPPPPPAFELTPEHQIVFVGNVRTEFRDYVRSSLEEVMAFHSDRYGVVVPEFTLYFGEDLEPVAAVYGEIHGRGIANQSR